MLKMNAYLVIFFILYTIASSVLSQTVVPPGENAVREVLLHLGINDSNVNWKDAFLLLASQYRMMYQEHKKDRQECKKEGLMISIRSKIEFWEDMLAPNFKFIGKQNDYTAYVNFHLERWTWIMEHSSDPIVEKMKEFVETKLNNNTNLFCTRIAGFFAYTSRSIHTPPLREYNVEEVDEIMRVKFNIDDDTTLKVVNFFMKT